MAFDVTGGCPPYEQFIKPLSGQWMVADVVVEGLCAGTYRTALRDQCGDLSPGVATVTQPAPLKPYLVSHEPVSCQGANDGSFEVGALGGTAPYEFSRNDGLTWQATGYFDGLAPDQYAVRIRDANECSRSFMLPVGEPPRLLLWVATIVPETAPGAADGSIEVQSFGGAGDHEYMLTDGSGWQSSPVFSGLTAGAYTVTVQDENSCQRSVGAVVDR